MSTIYPNFKNGKIFSFKFKAYLGKDENGKQIFKCKTWTPPKQMSENKLKALAEKEAAIWEHSLAQEVHSTQLTVASYISFDDFANQIWFPEQMNEERCRPATIAFHRDILKITISYMGKEMIQNIQPQSVKSYLDYLRNVYKTKNGKSLSPKTIRHHYSTLNLIFTYAEKAGYISSNPVKNVDTPKVVKRKVDALTKTQAIAFTEELKKLPLMQRTMYSLLLTTGMRRGECYGLKWEDIDLENQVIKIERSVTYTNEYGIKLGLPKTDTGIRYVPSTKHTTSLLSEYKAYLNTLKAVKQDMFVFPSNNSPYEPHNPSYITKHMKKFMKRAGLPDMSPQDLRHTCASLLLQSGADIKSVQDILGHSDASTTLNYYAKSDINVMRASAQKAFEM